MEWASAVQTAGWMSVAAAAKPTSASQHHAASEVRTSEPAHQATTSVLPWTGNEEDGRDETDAGMGKEGWVDVQAWRDVASQRAGWVSSHLPIRDSQLASAPVDDADMRW